MNAADLLDVLLSRRGWIADVERQLAGHDALVMPTVPIVAPRIADLQSADERYDGGQQLAAAQYDPDQLPRWLRHFAPLSRGRKRSCRLESGGAGRKRPSTVERGSLGGNGFGLIATAPQRILVGGRRAVEEQGARACAAEDSSLQPDTERSQGQGANARGRRVERHIVSAEVARKAADRTQNAEFKLHASDHFQPYCGDYLDRNVREQLAFLRKHVAV
jgi:hypothetical protein